MAGILIYLALAISSVEVNWQRVAEGLERGWRFVQGFLAPDFISRWGDIQTGPDREPDHDVDLDRRRRAHLDPDRHRRRAQPGALARLLFCRAIIAVSRTFQEMIIAIFFVAMFGFGPFAGFLTLAFATIGFMGKLLAEDIEDIDEAQAEAIRATGASFAQLINYGVQPQVMPRLIGLSLYRLDINFRESAVIGIVGAGGIGATLNTAIDRYEYDSAGAVLLIIIGIVMLAEYSSSHVRKWVQ